MSSVQCVACSMCPDTFLAGSSWGQTFCSLCVERNWVVEEEEVEEEEEVNPSPQSPSTCSECHSVLLPRRKEFPDLEAPISTVVSRVGGDVNTRARVARVARAVSTCLQCEMFLCARHVQEHGLTPAYCGHTLVPAPSVVTLSERRRQATQRGEEEEVEEVDDDDEEVDDDEEEEDVEECLCWHHGKPLVFYCKVDGALACVDCKRVGAHRGHDINSVEMVHTRRREEVEAQRLGIQRSKMEAQMRAEEYLGLCDSVERSAEEVRARVSESFALQRELLEAEERRAGLALEHVRARARSAAVAGLRCQRRQIARLKAAEAAVARAARGPLAPLAPLRHLQDNSIWEDVSACESPGSPDSSPVETHLDIEKIYSSTGINFQHLHWLLVNRYGRSPTLNPNSAHASLALSADLRSVSLCVDPPRRPEHRDRFEVYPQALAARSFSLGRHYWEVDVGAAGCWRVGATYGTLARKGPGRACWLGRNDASWCLESWAGALATWHANVECVVPASEKADGAAGGAGGGAGFGGRVGVYLDWERGVLAFYRAGSMVPLHTFRTRFAQPLYPAVGLWVGSLALCELP